MTDDSYGLHPYRSNAIEGQRYRELGEREYLAEKKRMAVDAIKEDPVSFADKIASRIVAATIWLHSDSSRQREHPQYIWCRLMAVVPFCGVVGFCLFGSFQRDPWMKPALCCYVFYLFPYVFVSYYERYAVPTSLMKILFVFWLFRSINSWFSDRESRFRGEAEASG